MVFFYTDISLPLFFYVFITDDVFYHQLFAIDSYVVVCFFAGFHVSNSNDKVKFDLIKSSN